MTSGNSDCPSNLFAFLGGKQQSTGKKVWQQLSQLPSTSSSDSDLLQQTGWSF